MGLGPAGATVDSILQTATHLSSSLHLFPIFLVIGCLDSHPIPQVSQNGKSCAAHGLSTEYMP